MYKEMKWCFSVWLYIIIKLIHVYIIILFTSSNFIPIEELDQRMIVPKKIPIKQLNIESVTSSSVIEIICKPIYKYN